MPRDTNGNTQPLPGTIVSTGDTILPSQHNPMVNDVYAMITQSLSRDGQGGMRAPLDMSGFRVINVGPAISANDAVSLSQFQTGTPIGAVVDFAGSSAPDTWLLCFGQSVSRSVYATLFSAIGTSFGAGDGSTTFNLPDYRGRSGVGKDDMGGTDAARLSTFAAAAKNIGSGIGTQTHTLSVSETPLHSHTGTTSSNGDHFHTYPGDSGASGGPSWQGGFRSSTAYNTSSSGIHSHTLTTSEVGGGQAHTNVQPSLIINKIIKVSY